MFDENATNDDYFDLVDDDYKKTKMIINTFTFFH